MLLLPWSMSVNSLFWGKDCLCLQLTSLVLKKRLSKMDNVSLQQTVNRIPPLKYQYPSSFLFDYVPTLDKDTFAILNTQRSNMQGEQCILIAKFCHEMYFEDPLERTKYRFLQQHHKQKIPALLQSHNSVCGLYTIYAAFHLFKFCQGETTGVQNFFYSNLYVKIRISLSISM